MEYSRTHRPEADILTKGSRGGRRELRSLGSGTYVECGSQPACDSWPCRDLRAGRDPWVLPGNRSRSQDPDATKWTAYAATSARGPNVEEFGRGAFGRIKRDRLEKTTPAQTPTTPAISRRRARKRWSGAGRPNRAPTPGDRLRSGPAAVGAPTAKVDAPITYRPTPTGPSWRVPSSQGPSWPVLSSPRPLPWRSSAWSPSPPPWLPWSSSLP